MVLKLPVFICMMFWTLYRFVYIVWWIFYIPVHIQLSKCCWGEGGEARAPSVDIRGDVEAAELFAVCEL